MMRTRIASPRALSSRRRGTSLFRTVRALPILGILLAVGCGGTSEDETDTPPTNPLLQPRNFAETAPDSFVARLETTKGVIRIRVHRDWAPLGADRFYNLLRAGYYDGVTFHRVIDGFVAEFGIHGDPWVNAAWRQATMEDEPVRKPNNRGMVTFSKSEPHTRTVQVFINTDDNPSLNGQGFSPFGEVIEGMEVVDDLYSGYGESPTRGGEGVYQAMAIARGEEYLSQEFPLLDRIERGVVEGPERAGGPGTGAAQTGAEEMEEAMWADGDQGSVPLEVNGVVWDREGLVERVGGDAEISWQVVGLFVSDLPRQIREIRDAQAEPHGEELERIAHSIKGAAGNVGADALADVARWLEEHASEASERDLERVLGRLEAEVDRFAAEVETRRP